MSSYTREDKLYILAHNCTINNLTPDSPAYKGYIKRVCVSKLSMSLNAVDEYTECLTTAYRADKWQGILNGEETLADTTPTEQAQVEPQTPRGNVLKTLTLNGPSEPIKTIPKKEVLEPELSPRTTAQILLRLARNNDFNGVGRLTLAEVRSELCDKSLQLEDIHRLLSQYAPQATIERRPGNVLLIYFDGKDTTQYHRNLKMIIPEEPLALKYEQEAEPEQLDFKPADFKAHKPKDNIW